MSPTSLFPEGATGTPSKTPRVGGLPRCISFLMPASPRCFLQPLQQEVAWPVRIRAGISCQKASVMVTPHKGSLSGSSPEAAAPKSSTYSPPPPCIPPNTPGIPTISHPPGGSLCPGDRHPSPGFFRDYGILREPS